MNENKEALLRELFTTWQTGAEIVRSKGNPMMAQVLESCAEMALGVLDGEIESFDVQVVNDSNQTLQ